MGQIVLGVAGAAVSTFAGLGPGIGWGIGSAIGAVAFADKPETQRVSQPIGDLKIVGTEYGQPIPWIRGRMRVAGQLWWNTDKRPITTVTRSGGGGKGGAGSAPETETESTVYEMDALYGLTTDNGKPIAGDKIVGIARIWDNGKLIWTNSALSLGSSIAASEITERWRRITVYKGAADQLPDPTYEAAMIALGKTPIAYRQRGSVFIEGLQLGSSGAVPNLTFEVIVDGGDGAIITYTFGGSPGAAGGGLWHDSFYDGRYIWQTDLATESVLIFDPVNRSWLSSVIVTDIPSPEIFIQGPPDNSFPAGHINYQGLSTGLSAVVMTESSVWGKVYINARGGFPYTGIAGPGTASVGTTLVFDRETREYEGNVGAIVGIPFAGANSGSYVIAIDEQNSLMLIAHGGFGRVALHQVDPETGLPLGGSIAIDETVPGQFNRGIVDAAGNFWFVAPSGGFLRIYRGGGAEGLSHQVHSAGPDGVEQFGLHGWAHDEARNCVYYLSADRRWLKRFNFADYTTTRINPVAYSIVSGDSDYMGGALGDAFPAAIHYSADEDRISLLHGGNFGTSHLRTVNPTTGVSELVVEIPNAHQVQFGGELVHVPGVWWSYSSDSTGALPGGIGEIRLGLAATCPTVAEVQATICERCGLTAAQYDVTALASITRGVCAFPWSQVSPGRQPTELLMSAYYYELTVSDKLYFRPRGGAPVATIEYEELGAVEGSGPTGEPLALRPGNDLELAAQMALDYANLDNDYQTDTQYSDRMVSATAATTKKVSLSMGFEPSEAKAIINTMLRDQVLSLITSQIAVLGHRALIEPTDVLLVNGPNGEQFRVRMVKKRDAFPLLGAEIVLDDASILSDVGITSLDYTSSTDLGGPVDTVFELLDIPILRDADNDPGFYIPAKGTGTPYAGSAIYKSPNDVNFERIVTINESAVIGVTTTALGNWSGPRVFDYKNSVTVDVGRGVLTTSTRELVLVNSVNALLIGDEIIQFLKATAVGVNSAGDPIYKLTGLLRGSRGTEWAMTGHAIGERVVLLRTAGLRRHVLENSELGVQKYYKGVTLGRSVASANSEPFTGNGVGLKPFSPWDLRATRDVSDNITFTWQRRTRLATRTVGPLGISIPLGESDESYELDIYDIGSPEAIVRTISVTVSDPSDSPSATYSAAQQATDGLTPGASVLVGAYQISATVGRGYEHRATV